jgi:hypothetical protein
MESYVLTCIEVWRDDLSILYAYLGESMS